MTSVRRIIFLSIVLLLVAACDNKPPVPDSPLSPLSPVQPPTARPTLALPTNTPTPWPTLPPPSPAPSPIPPTPSNVIQGTVIEVLSEPAGGNPFSFTLQVSGTVTPLTVTLPTGTVFWTTDDERGERASCLLLPGVRVAITGQLARGASTLQADSARITKPVTPTLSLPPLTIQRPASGDVLLVLRDPNAKLDPDSNLVALDTLGNVRYLTESNDVTEAIFSPDGRYLAYTRRINVCGVTAVEVQDWQTGQVWQYRPRLTYQALPAAFSTPDIWGLLIEERRLDLFDIRALTLNLLTGQTRDKPGKIQVGKIKKSILPAQPFGWSTLGGLIYAWSYIPRSDSGPGGIFAIDMNGNAQPVAASRYAESLSPDGRYIAHTTYDPELPAYKEPFPLPGAPLNVLWLTDLFDGQTSQIITDPTRLVRTYSVRWSPDGERLLFEWNRLNDEGLWSTELRTIRPDGTEMDKVANLGLQDQTWRLLDYDWCGADAILYSVSEGAAGRRLVRIDLRDDQTNLLLKTPLFFDIVGCLP